MSAPSSPSRSNLASATGAAPATDSEALHQALIQWVASFASPQSAGVPSRPPCKHMADLADGVVLFQVAAQVDKDWFRLIGTLEHTPSPTSSSTTAASSAHWIPRYNNLKKLHRLLTSYLTDVLGMPDPTPTRPILLDKIARHADADQLAHLTSLLLVVAVHSPATPQVIARIQQLETRVQALLMQVIEGYLVQLQQQPGSRGGSPVAGAPSAATDPEHDDAVVSQAQVAQLLMEKRQIEARHRQLQLDYEALAGEYEAAAAQARGRATALSATSTENLSESLSPTAASSSLSHPSSGSSGSTASSSGTTAVAVAAATGTLTADLTIARAEITRLHAQLAQADEARHDLEITHANQARMLADQARRLAEVADQAALVRSLRDQVDELSDASAQAARAQAQVDKLKARLADMGEVRRQAKETQEECVRLKAQVARYEAELLGRSRGSTAETGVEAGRAAREWEARFLALQEQHARVVAEVEHVQEANARLEGEVAKERERLAELVEQVRELEEQAASAAMARGESLSASLSEADALDKRMQAAAAAATGVADGGERAKWAAEVADLRAQVAALQQERTVADAQFEGHKQLLAKARALIVQANKERAELVEQHAAELTKAKAEAATTAAAAASTSQSGKDAFPEAVQALQLQVEGYQRETQALWAENKALRDQWRREQACMASAWYHVVSAKAGGVGVAAGSTAGSVGGGNGTGPSAANLGGQVGNTWLAQQRRLLSEHIVKQF